MADTILVTGALGNVGSAVVQALSAAGYAPRAADLSVTQLRARHGEMVEAVALDQTRRGMSAFVTGEVARLLGRPPISLRQFAADYRAVWQPQWLFKGWPRRAWLRLSATRPTRRPAAPHPAARAPRWAAGRR